MRTQFVLGPAGSGKTSLCLDQIRSALCAAPEGLPLVLIAPKQATFQLERALLGHPGLFGYTRLQILSFDRLAEFVISELRETSFRLLNEQGRTMVLRALIGQHQTRLRIFRASSRMPGFSQELSNLFRELQQHKLPPKRLRQLSEQTNLHAALRDKLHDVALLLESYEIWLNTHRVEDPHRRIDVSTELLKKVAADARAESCPPTVRFGGLWLDGFASLTPQELELLAALVPLCDQAVLAFCLDREPSGNESWLSTWSMVGETFRCCFQRLSALPDCEISRTLLPRNPAIGRFAQNPVLGMLERFWSEPQPCTVLADDSAPSGVRIIASRQTTGSTHTEVNPGLPLTDSPLRTSIQIFQCANRDTEALMAAREILCHVHAGGRFRDTAVLLRNLDLYHDALRRVFRRHGIPYFMDRREPVAHHPLADLTRFSLRAVTFGWNHEDLFGALKSGLFAAAEKEIDQLENEALRRGWEATDWQRPLEIPGNPRLEATLETLRKQILPPFHKLSRATSSGNRQPTGEQLADALRQFWKDVHAGKQLDTWSGERIQAVSSALPPAPIHATVWTQMNEWLDDLERAFSGEAIPMRDWLPILEAGLSGLTVGVIPPALDQVLIGAVDRSRNPELQLVVLLGANESVFPAVPAPRLLLTDSDRADLEREDVWLGPGIKERLGHELYLGYIGCTRANRRLVLSYANADASERHLSPSRFIDHLKRIFPQIQTDEFIPQQNWMRSDHAGALIAPLVQIQKRNPNSKVFLDLMEIPELKRMLDPVIRMAAPPLNESLSAGSIDNLYGLALRTSASRIEKFAECPFQFLIQSGLRAQERLRFEADARTLGSFQHELLKRFHEEARKEGRHWRDLSPEDARSLVRQLGAELESTFGDGVFRADKRSQFVARSLTRAIESFIETTVAWMRDRNDFDPVAAELRFGDDGDLPPWTLVLDEKHSLLFTGLIDRVDLWKDPNQSHALCVVVDYKSSARKMDERMLANGLQLQLPAYLSALRSLPNPSILIGVERILPVGVFYVSLRGEHKRGQNRDEVVNDSAARATAYRHSGRFDAAYLNQLDRQCLTPNSAKTPTQFNFKITAKGELHKRYKDPMQAHDFLEMLDRVEAQMIEMGKRIFNGEATVAPYRHNNATPCDFCDYRAICRIDPWTHPYRALL